MLLGELLALGVHAALEASLQFHRNSLGRTVVVTQIPAEHRAGEGRRSLDGLDQGKQFRSIFWIDRCHGCSYHGARVAGAQYNRDRSQLGD